jgi:hypothetical protein
VDLEVARQEGVVGRTRAEEGSADDVGPCAWDEEGTYDGAGEAEEAVVQTLRRVMRSLYFPISAGGIGITEIIAYEVDENEGKYTHMLQLCKHFFANTVFVELGLNAGNDFIYDRAVDCRLKNFSVTRLNYYSQVRVNSSPLSYLTLWMPPATFDTASAGYVVSAE